MFYTNVSSFELQEMVTLTLNQSSPYKLPSVYLCISGQSFPQLKESDAMFSAEKAPEWKDADCCSRCRATFGMVQRKVCLSHRQEYNLKYNIDI